MTERELLYIKTIVEEKSISKAAQKLFLTQPSLSKCVQKIETSLGTTLFKRTNTGLIPTFAGQRYYQVATEILKMYNDFEIEISDINNLKKGRITIGCTIYLATHILPVILPIFKRECPNIELFVVEKNSTELEKDLSAGKVDFALMHTSPVYKISNMSNIDFHPLFKDPFLLVTKKDHPLKRYAVKIENSDYPKIDITLFANEPFILVKREQRIRQVSELILQKANINPNIVLTTKSFEIARRLACQGIGVTFVPLQYSQIFPGTYEPAYYSIDEKYSPYWTMCIAVQKDAYISKAAKLFIRMVSERFGSKILDL
ncbi:Transcriptional regulator, LysR family [Tepidanaerobacter acetatoxydans Re1]|uniref:Transcriptional regulator, LysR family n=1 Tax=Tepidanaerobacter acetatoxydans (strain DSM 21804 / JCM 16047 / Re1) TaxID=1209989 RepID=F4LSL1_TEPAE|nr:LysR family transcriptional regulator [Tepidanaerobacter acetatoxydans]AEE92401.1 transcriptional regulator, LysR family [Tepidanaerobacter acetatoxydans Re1]CCP27301.1 Transcriptional regulator, LysR family [Tepidanaerobacter acetatoxydans Re1]